MQELTKVRKIVAELELSRIIEYKNHRDHTAHTLYLFLLGIWIYDSVYSVREAFTNKIQKHLKSKIDEYEIAEIFILQWLYASLLHDVGYVFSELGPETVSYRKKIDKLYDLRWLQTVTLKEISNVNDRQKARGALTNAHKNFTQLYGGDSWPTKTCKTNQPLEVLRRISYMPWIKELSSTSTVTPDVFSLFDTPSRGSDDLKTFTYDVAENGYPNNGKGTVDHAVASGLILLQYSTYWNWLMMYMKNESPDAYNIVRGLFAEAELVLIVEACRAAAYHNITLAIGVDRFSIHVEPLIFLGILCDELSTWDRFHASKDLSAIWTQRNFLESSDILLNIHPNINGNIRAHVEILNRKFKNRRHKKCSQQEIV